MHGGLDVFLGPAAAELLRYELDDAVPWNELTLLPVPGEAPAAEEVLPRLLVTGSSSSSPNLLEKVRRLLVYFRPQLLDLGLHQGKEPLQAVDHRPPPLSVRREVLKQHLSRALLPLVRLPRCDLDGADRASAAEGHEELLARGRRREGGPVRGDGRVPLGGARALHAVERTDGLYPLFDPGQEQRGIRQQPLNLGLGPLHHRAEGEHAAVLSKLLLLRRGRGVLGLVLVALPLLLGLLLRRRGRSDGRTGDRAALDDPARRLARPFLPPSGVSHCPERGPEVREHVAELAGFLAVVLLLGLLLADNEAGAFAFLLPASLDLADDVEDVAPLLDDGHDDFEHALHLLPCLSHPLAKDWQMPLHVAAPSHERCALVPLLPEFFDQFFLHNHPPLKAARSLARHFVELDLTLNTGKPSLDVLEPRALVAADIAVVKPPLSLVLVD
mmetsp:Transcript_28142/g.56201  ORF Transcript_28142/g.56201 Transcript_28142/m.56201 type:complete len:443 (-) Transcript_28142:872-2200(-)